MQHQKCPNLVTLKKPPSFEFPLVLKHYLPIMVLSPLMVYLSSLIDHLLTDIKAALLESESLIPVLYSDNYDSNFFHVILQFVLLCHEYLNTWRKISQN